MTNVTVREFIANKIKIDSEGCWIWQGPLHPKGYGLTKYKNKSWRVHRLSYEAFKGLIKNQLDHTCKMHGASSNKKNCCNPLHLEDVTAEVNKRRGCGWTQNSEGNWFCPSGHEVTGYNALRIQNYTVCRSCRRQYACALKRK